MGQISTDQTIQTSDKWAELSGQIIDRLLGKNMSTAYDFNQLTIDIPKAEGPGGKHIGSVQWIVNGRIVITTETREKGKPI